jgi:hypothetical protein
MHDRRPVKMRTRQRRASCLTAPSERVAVVRRATTAHRPVQLAFRDVLRQQCSQNRHPQLVKLPAIDGVDEYLAATEY